MLETACPVTYRFIPAKQLKTILSPDAEDRASHEILEVIGKLVESNYLPLYLPDLAKAELARHTVMRKKASRLKFATTDRLTVNPTLELVEVAWDSLLSLIEGQEVTPVPLSQVLMFWLDPETGEYRQSVANMADLLALKIVSEQLDPEKVAAESDRPIGIIDSSLDVAASKGLLLKPPSKLRRNHNDLPFVKKAHGPFLVADGFTLQWHITQKCDLHCRHCYDRSDQHDVDFDHGLRILDQMRRFCLDHHVRGQITFTGGNPFLHPYFYQLYQAAHNRNLTTAILANPVKLSQLDALLEIGKPTFFQVSLEGLQKHNDEIRGHGNFHSVVAFLDLLREKGVYSMVMLTLSRANLDQVIPLADLLRDRTDLITFNRLATVGEGADLETPRADEYRAFVKEYLAARRKNPIVAIKDSLINLEMEQDGEVFGGCTGSGCGAAFNFLAMLPGGQVHACRKFPSPVGNIQKQSLEDIYFSKPAQAYRRGCQACLSCRFRPVCGGCMAVTHGCGLDPFKEKDPACYLKEQSGSGRS